MWIFAASFASWLTAAAGRLAVARAFGDLDLKQNNNLPAEKQKVSCEPDVRCEQALNRDVLVLACDGIWGTNCPLVHNFLLSGFVGRCHVQ